MLSKGAQKQMMLFFDYYHFENIDLCVSDGIGAFEGAEFLLHHPEILLCLDEEGSLEGVDCEGLEHVVGD
jgi:hypothetical protein